MGSKLNNFHDLCSRRANCAQNCDDFDLLLFCSSRLASGVAKPLEQRRRPISNNVSDDGRVANHVIPQLR